MATISTLRDDFYFDTRKLEEGMKRAKEAVQKIAPRQCKSKGCKRQTRHESHKCAECRYHAEMDKAEVRYEVTTAKAVRPTLEEMTRPVDTARAICDGE